MERLTVPGHEGRPLRCVVHDGSRGWALLFPGGGYLPQAPLCWFARECLAERGLGVVELWWEVPDSLGDEEGIDWVYGHARAVVKGWPPDALVGKSLGTEAIAILASRCRRSGSRRRCEVRRLRRGRVRRRHARPRRGRAAALARAAR